MKMKAFWNSIDRTVNKLRDIFKPKVVVSIAVLLLLVVVINFFVYITFADERVNRRWEESIHDIEIMEFGLNGYELKGNTFTNIIGDANIQLPRLNQYVENILIRFAEPTVQPLEIKVYFAEGDNQYSEESTSVAMIWTNSSQAYLKIGREITTCRIDIGTKVGEQFVLDSIILNSSEMEGMGVDKTLNIFKAVILHLFLIFIIAVACMLFIFRPSIEKAFVMAALPLGIFYMIIITPLSGPDEHTHYIRSYRASNAILFQGDEAEANVAHFDYSGLTIHYNVSSGYQRLMQWNSAGEMGAETTVVQTINLLQNSNYTYFPQAVGIAAARLLNLGFIPLFLLGRFTNLLFFVACFYFAIKFTPKFKLFFCIVGLFPMAIHQAASFSYDAFINGVSAILIAFLFKGIYEQGPLPRRDFMVILVSGMLLAPAKIVYTPILLLLFLIPTDRFRDKRSRMIQLGAVFGAAALMLLALQLSTFTSQIAPVAENPQLNWEGGINYTLYDIFGDPLRTIRIFGRTFKSQASGWFWQAIGSSLSGLTLRLPKIIMRGFLALSLLSMHHDMVDEGPRLGIAVRASFWAVSAIVTGLIMLSMFLGWTSNTRGFIQGVQGRYFIPILPLIMMPLTIPQLKLPKWADKPLIIAALFLQLTVIWCIVDYTIKN